MKVYPLEPAPAAAADQAPLRVARRTMTTSTVANPNRGDPAMHLRAPGLHSFSGPVRTPLPEANCPSEPVPIWLAVLHATSCKAKRNGENFAVRWNWVAGRAVYTNAGRDAEHIEPLGVSLKAGHTVAVSWEPGETAYTVEVYRQAELCA
jgi:hypothetical protein